MLGPTARTQQPRVRARPVRTRTRTCTRIRNVSAYTQLARLVRALPYTRPRPWSPVMNGLRRLTLICHFISLIQPPRALSVPRQSHSIPPHPRSSTTSSSSTSSATLTLTRLEHPIPARPSACTPPSPPTNCFVGEAKKGGRERKRERERERESGGKGRDGIKKRRERETLSRRKNASARPSVRRVTYAWPPN